MHGTIEYSGENNLCEILRWFRVQHFNTYLARTLIKHWGAGSLDVNDSKDGPSWLHFGGAVLCFAIAPIFKRHGTINWRIEY